jgi:drug/metabolite transporter (DMT)-like permease
VCLSLALPWQLAEAPPLSRGALFLLLGLFAGIGHWFVIGAYLLAPASMLTPFAYLQLIWATAYGFVLFDQLPDRASAAGMTIIIASGVWLALQERGPSRDRAAARESRGDRP